MDDNSIIIFVIKHFGSEHGVGFLNFFAIVENIILT